MQYSLQILPTGFPLEERWLLLRVPVGPALLRGGWGRATLPIKANGQPTDAGDSGWERSSSIDVRVISLSLCDHECTMGRTCNFEMRLTLWSARESRAAVAPRARDVFCMCNGGFARLAKRDSQLLSTSRRPTGAWCGNYGVVPGDLRGAPRRAGHFRPAGPHCGNDGNDGVDAGMSDRGVDRVRSAIRSEGCRPSTTPSGAGSRYRCPTCSPRAAIDSRPGPRRCGQG
jgi:hypothetical protein